MYYPKGIANIIQILYSPRRNSDQPQPRTTATKTSSTKGRSRGRPDLKTRLVPTKAKKGVQMAVHERKTSKFLGLYNTGRPSNSRLGLTSPYVERNNKINYNKQKFFFENTFI